MINVAEPLETSNTRKPEAAVAIVRTRGPDPKILLMRRAEREGDPWSGHWSLPGGRCEECDVDLLETALRELHEECGIRLSREQMSTALPPMVARRRTGPFLLVAPFVFEIDTELPTILDAREAAGEVWIPQRALLDPNQHSMMRVPGTPPHMWFPAIALPGTPLWGFTYRLLADWLEISPRECASTGFDVARTLLDFLLSRGLTLRSAWQLTPPAAAGEPGPVQVARVTGPIPAEAVIAHLTVPDSCVTKVNAIEVQPQYIRVHGLASEQYLIEAVALSDESAC